MDIHASLLPSPWVVRFAPLIPAGGPVLDLACGHGRHSRLLAGLGYRVAAVDRNEQALSGLCDIANIDVQAVDTEAGPWPFADRRFDGIVVTNYLYRPRLPMLLATLRDGGVLIYETFMRGNERYGKPSNPDFLLRPDELLDVVRTHLNVVAFEQGLVESPRPAVIQRICAIAEALPRIP